MDPVCIINSLLVDATLFKAGKLVIVSHNAQNTLSVAITLCHEMYIAKLAQFSGCHILHNTKSQYTLLVVMCHEMHNI